MKISISLDKKLLDYIDKDAKQNYRSRSQEISYIIALYILSEPIHEKLVEISEKTVK